MVREDSIKNAMLEQLKQNAKEDVITVLGGVTDQLCQTGVTEEDLFLFNMGTGSEVNILGKLSHNANFQISIVVQAASGFVHTARF